jgi:hypothetical protein
VGFVHAALLHFAGGLGTDFERQKLVSRIASAGRHSGFY